MCSIPINCDGGGEGNACVDPERIGLGAPPSSQEDWEEKAANLVEGAAAKGLSTVGKWCQLGNLPTNWKQSRGASLTPTALIPF